MKHIFLLYQLVALVSILAGFAGYGFCASSDYPNFDVSSTASGYSVIEDEISETDTGLLLPLSFNGDKEKNLFGQTIQDLVVQVDYETSDRIHVKIFDKDEKQFPVPNSPLGVERPVVTSADPNPNYEFKYSTEPFGFQVIRKSDEQVLFDTNEYPLVFEDQYLEISSHLPQGTNIYGLGENSAPFRKTENITTIFASGANTPPYQNVYGHQPFYTEIRSDGTAHGCLLLNIHGMDVFLTSDRITYKVIGGVLDFYFFVPKDTKPNSVIQSYTDLVGKPFMPSHWMLGWQQCRYGYENISVAEDVIEKYKEHEIPLEVAWIDIDYMEEYKDFTTDPVNFPEDKMRALAQKLHHNKQHMITMVNPAIATNTSYEPYVRGHDLDVFIKNPDGKSEYIGAVWPGYTVFPDFWHPNAEEYWTKEIVDWMKRLGYLSGLWVDMNEPSSYCLGSCGHGKVDEKAPDRDSLEAALEDQRIALEEWGYTTDSRKNLLYPNYRINNVDGNLSDETVAMTAQHYGGIPHYDLHSLYGHSHCVMTHKALLAYNSTERPFILTRSNAIGTGKYAGHWTGDNWSTWWYLKVSISEILNQQIFGLAYSGSDVCGHNANATEILCTRWQEIGAFYPFARNHNTKGMVDQYPYLWESTAEATRKALAIRYSLLPYYYTLFEEAHRLGTPVWRSLFFEYPQAQHLADVDAQVLVGSDILLSPAVLDENQTTVDAQFPPNTLWYDWYTYGPVTEEKVTLDAELTHIPVHVRGGAIVPLKSAKMLVQDTFDTPYSLLVALDLNGEAEGRLYIDDGHSLEPSGSSDIQFTLRSGVLKGSGNFGYENPEPLDMIRLLAVADDEHEFEEAIYNGETYPLEKEDNKSFVLKDVHIQLTEPFSIEFK